MDSNSIPSLPNTSNSHENLPNPPQPPLQPPREPENPIPDEIEAYFRDLPPGYRFKPTDEELILSYLRKKVDEQPLPLNRILDVNLYAQHPSKLIDLYRRYGDGEWYFFTPRFKKYAKGQRPSRSADDGSGFWKATGADKKIYFPAETKNIIGLRNALVFYEGSASDTTPPPSKTDWILHEYLVKKPKERVVDPNDDMLDRYVLCKVYINKRKRKRDDDDDGNDVNPQPTDIAVVDDAGNENNVANEIKESEINNGVQEVQNDEDYTRFLADHDEAPSSSGTMNQVSYVPPHVPPQQPVNNFQNFNHNNQFLQQKPNYYPPLRSFGSVNGGQERWISVSGNQFQSIGNYNDIPRNYQFPAVTRNFNSTAFGHDPYNRMVQHPYNYSTFPSGNNGMPLRSLDHGFGRNMVDFQNVVSGCNNFGFGSHSGFGFSDFGMEGSEPAMKRGRIGDVEGEKKEKENCHAANQVPELDQTGLAFRAHSPTSTTTSGLIGAIVESRPRLNSTNDSPISTTTSDDLIGAVVESRPRLTFENRSPISTTAT